MKTITLFSSGCPKCTVLKHKLDEKNIPYEISEDFDELIEHNLQTVPVLKVDGEYYQFGDAVKLIGELE